MGASERGPKINKEDEGEQKADERKRRESEKGQKAND